MTRVKLENTPQDALESIAKCVRATRINREMTVAELAKRAGIGRSSVLRLEKLGHGSIETLMKVMAVLGTLDILVSGLTVPPKQLTIADLKKSAETVRQRVRRKPSGTVS